MYLTKDSSSFVIEITPIGTHTLNISFYLHFILESQKNSLLICWLNDGIITNLILLWIATLKCYWPLLPQTCVVRGKLVKYFCDCILKCIYENLLIYHHVPLMGKLAYRVHCGAHSIFISPKHGYWIYSGW